MKLFKINKSIKIITLMGKFKKIKELDKYYYLYLLAQNIEIEFYLFKELFIMPRDYKLRYKYQVDVQKKIDKIFLLQLARNIPIKNWLGKDFHETISISHKLNIYNNKLDISNIKKSVLNEGYIGGEISREIDKRVNEYINSYK